MVQAMEKLVDQGLVKHIGVSNFSVKKLKDLLSYARIKPAVNQIEVHPYFRNDYNIEWCRSQACTPEAGFCPTASIPAALSFGAGLVRYGESTRAARVPAGYILVLMM